MSKVSAWGQTLDQKSTTECGVSEYDHEASVMRRPWLTGGCWAMEKKLMSLYSVSKTITLSIGMWYN
jgi:hypothetical protein